MIHIPKIQILKSQKKEFISHLYALQLLSFYAGGVVCAIIIGILEVTEKDMNNIFSGDYHIISITCAIGIAILCIVGSFTIINWFKRETHTINDEES